MLNLSNNPHTVIILPTVQVIILQNDHFQSCCITSPGVKCTAARLSYGCCPKMFPNKGNSNIIHFLSSAIGFKF